MRKLLSLALLIPSFCLAQQDSVRIPNDSLIEIVRADQLQAKKADDAEVYRLKPAVDIPLTVAATAWTLYGFSQIYSKDTSTRAQILALNRNDVAGYNRFGTDLYSENAADVSDLFFYGSMPLPLLLLLDKKIRPDAGKIGLMYIESMAVTGVLYTGAAYIKDKYRPYAYNPETPMGKRQSGGAKNSFFAGHVALVANATFFTAKVYSDYHPESRAKWVLYSAAGLATATTGYLRMRGGLHFLSDVVIGTAVGTLNGILFPQWHKTRKGRDRLTLLPYYGPQSGVALTWKF
jgi:membrane-associated phospholipid phosphatase